MQSNNEENANGGQMMNHAEEPLGRTYSQGPVLLRGKMIPSDSTSERFLRNDSDTDWLHRDPWRVLRIQAEFVDGFGSLAELGPAVSIFGSARIKPNTKDYKAAAAMGAKIAERDIAVITGLDGIVVNEVGFETANLFKHRIDVGNKIALDREAGKCSEFDNTQMIPFVDLMGEVLLECVDVVCVVDIAGTAESLVVGVGDVG